jgi:hypothetical protein
MSRSGSAESSSSIVSEILFHAIILYYQILYFRVLAALQVLRKGFLTVLSLVSTYLGSHAL